jgi:hypothetical protein
VRIVLTRSNAFVRPEESEGIRLRIPDAADLACEKK